MRQCWIFFFCCFALVASRSLDTLKPCSVQRTLVQQFGEGGDFVPICDANGDYASMQCRQGFCWCAAKDGTQLSKSKAEIPDCSQYQQ